MIKGSFFHFHTKGNHYILLKKLVSEPAILLLHCGLICLLHMDAVVICMPPMWPRTLQLLRTYILSWSTDTSKHRLLLPPCGIRGGDF